MIGIGTDFTKAVFEAVAKPVPSSRGELETDPFLAAIAEIPESNDGEDNNARH